MQAMRDELDDIAFKVLNEEAYATIDRRLRSLREESGDLLREIEQALTEKLVEHHIPAMVTGREKRPYSIWRKMERKQISLGQLSDIYGFRVIVDNIDDYVGNWMIHCVNANPQPFVSTILGEQLDADRIIISY